jgi:hypothetical protein
MAENRKIGRPSKYTQELADEICETIAANGVALSTLCKQNPHWPHVDTLYQWMNVHPSFSEAYAKAKRRQVTAFVEDIIKISDDSSRDTVTNEDGKESFNHEWVARSRLRVDTRKWIAAKLVPRLYGDNALARELADEIEEFRQKLKLGSKKDGGEEAMDSGRDQT